MARFFASLTVIGGILEIERNIRFVKISEGYEDGVDWINGMNKTWRSVIGASEMSVDVQSGCICLDPKDLGGADFEGFHPDVEDCSTIETPDHPTAKCKPVYTSEFHVKDSDAFILAESAKNGPGMNYEPQLMEGSNHIQMRNDSEMKDAVEKIFVEGLNKEYFKTE